MTMTQIEHKTAKRTEDDRGDEIMDSANKKDKDKMNKSFLENSTVRRTTIAFGAALMLWAVVVGAMKLAPEQDYSAAGVFSATGVTIPVRNSETGALESKPLFLPK